jgi:hypothetical protein
VPSACGSVPSARAVPGCIASVIGAAQSRARPVHLVSGASAAGPLPRGGRVIGSGVLSRHGDVFSWTAGECAVLSRSRQAAAR